MSHHANAKVPEGILTPITNTVTKAEQISTPAINITSTPLLPADIDEESPNFLHFGTPEQEQADEQEWQSQFAASENFLEELVAEARLERKQGKTLPLDCILVQAEQALL